MAITAMEVLEKISPSGPCVPGLGVLAFLLSIPVIVVLVVRNISLAFTKAKKCWIIVALHLVIIGIFLILAKHGII